MFPSNTHYEIYNGILLISWRLYHITSVRSLGSFWIEVNSTQKCLIWSISLLLNVLKSLLLNVLIFPRISVWLDLP